MEPKPVSLLALHRAYFEAGAATRLLNDGLVAAGKTSLFSWSKEERRVVLDANARWTETATALRAALMDAPHGRQADGSFVTDRAYYIDGDMRRRTLWAPANQGPLMWVEYDHSGPTPNWKIYTREEGAKIGAEHRRNRQEAERAFQAARQEIIDHMLGGGEVVYSPGEKGGRVWMRKPGATPVPALGVFAAVGMSEAQIRQVTDCPAASWTLKTVRAPRSFGPMMDPRRGLRGRRRSAGGERRGGEVLRHLLAEAV